MTGVTGTVYINAGTKPEFIGCTFEDNTMTFAEGAGIRSYYAGQYNGQFEWMRIENTVFRNLRANANYGGAVTTSGNTRMKGCTFEGNYARTYATAIAFVPEGDAGSLEISDCVFQENSGRSGIVHVGGDHPDGARITITDTVIKNNAVEKLGKG